MVLSMEQQAALILSAASMEPSRLRSFPVLCKERVASSLSHSKLIDAESVEDDCYEYTADLAEQIAHFILGEEEDSDGAGTLHAKAAWTLLTQLSCSPQSTLSGMNYWGRRGYSPMSSSGVPSPPSPLPLPSQAKKDTFGLLYMELTRLRMAEEIRAIKSAMLSSGHAYSLSRSSKLACLPKAAWPQSGRTNFVGISAESQSYNAPNQYIGAGRQLQAPDCYSHQHHQHVVSNPRSRNGTVSLPLYGYQASPHSDHQPTAGDGGSRMQAVFLGQHRARESLGTGVFLPRRAGNKAECIKKPACSIGLLPKHTAQALNLNIADRFACARSSIPACHDQGITTLGGVDRFEYKPGSSVSHAYTAAPADVTANVNRSRPMAGKWSPSRTKLQEVHAAVSLPPEWTY